MSDQTVVAAQPTGAIVARFALQAAARELLPSERVAWCLRRFRGGAVGVDIVANPDRQSAYYDGLMRCHRLWMCPVCAAAISEKRRAELSDLLAKNVEPMIHADGESVSMLPRYFVTMLTFTLQHERDETCVDVLARLDKAWKVFRAGRWFAGFRERYYIVGTLRALELTHGDGSGWHPHFHVLFFHDSYFPPDLDWSYNDQLGTTTKTPDLLRPTQAQFRDAASYRWRDVLSNNGGYSDFMRGVEISVGKVALYPEKIIGDREVRDWDLAAEATKQPVKHGRNGNRTLIDLLIAYTGGDDRAGYLWTEAVQALDGRKHIEPSKGLWKRLGRELSTDEQASEECVEPTHVVLANLNWEEWKIVLRHNRRGEVLEVAKERDVIRLEVYLASLGIARFKND